MSAAANTVTTTAPPPASACRPRCGACCTAPSITSPIPGMPDGKPAGVPCVQLDDDLRCRLFGHPERPAFCGGLQPSHEMCGDGRTQAMHWLGELERLTEPSTLSSAAKRRGVGRGRHPATDQSAEAPQGRG